MLWFCGLIQVMFLVGLTLSALTVSTSDASFAGYVAKSAKLHIYSYVLLVYLAFGFAHESIFLVMSSSCFIEVIDEVTFRSNKLHDMFLLMMIMFDCRSAGGGKVRGSQEHKVVEVKQLAMYWNPHSHPLGASLEATDNQIISVLRREEDTPDKVVYLLRPTDVTLKLLVHA